MLITFPLALWATWHFTGVQGWASIGLIVALIVLGLFAEQYLDAWAHFQESRKREKVLPEILETLKTERRHLIETL